MSNNNIYSSFYLYKKHKQLLCSDPKYAFLYFKDFRINLLTGKKEDTSIEHLVLYLESKNLDENLKSPHVIHLFFELGYFFTGLENLIDANKPLAIIIKYNNAVEKDIDFNIQENFNFESNSSISFKEYQTKFNEVQRNLKEGQCYQLNLTAPFYFKFDKELKPEDFINALWKNTLAIGAYSHYTYIGTYNKLFLSNSPECLFQYDKSKRELVTMPIKGTVNVSSFKDREAAWEYLIKSKKDETELNIITDLLRNDMTKIQLNPSRVLSLKRRLEVPGLIHQYSMIATKLSANTSLAVVLRALFPGGSITGAPKKRVMELTKRIENYQRGLYTGSTVLLYEKMACANINIRTAQVDFENYEIKYGAGGGITVQSTVKEEYEELFAKLESFLRVFTK